MRCESGKKKGRGAVGSLGFIEEELYRVGRQGGLAYEIWQRLEGIKTAHGMPRVWNGQLLVCEGSAPDDGIR